MYDVEIVCKKKRFRVEMPDATFAKLKEEISAAERFLKIGELLLVSKDEIVYIDADRIPEKRAK